LDKCPRPNKKAIAAWLKIVYALYDKPVPARVEIVPSPQAALALGTELTGTKQTALDWCGISDAGWVSFADVYNRLGVESDEEFADSRALREFQRGCWDTLLLDECAIIVAFPTSIKRDADGNLHNPKGPCIKWGDGNQDFAWHGVWVPERIVMDPKSYTKAEYLAIKETEVRRALCESAGHTHIVKLLGATETNTWKDPNTSLKYALYKAPSGETWLRKQSPRLQNEKQPYYFEPVHEDLLTAQAARKWQACNQTPAQCEADPVLVYDAET
jgi:hypothetical protein